MAAGYSGTPLATKLGIREGARLALIDAPEGFLDLLDPLPDGVDVRSSLRGGAHVVVYFTKQRGQAARRIDALARAIFPDGACWVAWPKRASKVPTDMTEDVVRELALPRGLVDNKVCAIDEVWSGLRIVHRVERRGR